MKYDFVVYDRDGGELVFSEEPYDSYEEADDAALFYADYPAYGSHEVFPSEG